MTSYLENPIHKVQYKNHVRWLLVSFIVIAGSLWGLNTTISKFAADGGIHAFSMSFWQSVIAALSFGVLAYCMGEKIKLTRKLICICLVCGSIGTALPNALLFTAVSHVSVGIISITISLTPLMTLVLSVIIKTEKNSIRKTIGIIAGIISVLCIIFPEASFSGNHELSWLLIILLAPLGYATMNIVLGRFIPESDTPLCILSGMFTVVAISSFILMLFVPNSFHMISLPFDKGEISTLLLGLFIFIAHALYIYTVKKAGAVFASLATYIVAISGVFWGVILLGETHTLWVWLALLLIVLSVYLVQPKQQYIANE